MITYEHTSTGNVRNLLNKLQSSQKIIVMIEKI